METVFDEHRCNLILDSTDRKPNIYKCLIEGCGKRYGRDLRKGIWYLATRPEVQFKDEEVENVAPYLRRKFESLGLEFPPWGYTLEQLVPIQNNQAEIRYLLIEQLEKQLGVDVVKDQQQYKNYICKWSGLIADRNRVRNKIEITRRRIAFAVYQQETHLVFVIWWLKLRLRYLRSELQDMPVPPDYEGSTRYINIV